MPDRDRPAGLRAVPNTTDACAKHGANLSPAAAVGKPGRASQPSISRETGDDDR
ncbi:MAG: hypothetical protein JWO25_2231, partial [Alphaproteobacteria bacterium]|nr:hypothetical protein [Alphaproteobacteria bacterium]